MESAITRTVRRQRSGRGVDRTTAYHRLEFAELYLLHHVVKELKDNMRTKQQCHGHELAHGRVTRIYVRYFLGTGGLGQRLGIGLTVGLTPPEVH